MSPREMKYAISAAVQRLEALEALVIAQGKQIDELTAETAQEKERHGEKRKYQRRGTASQD